MKKLLRLVLLRWFKVSCVEFSIKKLDPQTEKKIVEILKKRRLCNPRHSAQ